MRRRTAVAMVAAILALLLAPVPVSAGPDNPGGDEAEFVALVNAARARGGVAPLQVDGQLTGLARDWASQMAWGVCGEGKRICHAGSLSAGVSADWEKLGENVGVGPDVGSVMNAFIASSGHNANLMDPAFTKIGVGVVWKDGAMYTVHRFLQVRGEGAPPPAPEPKPEPAPKPERAPAAKPDPAPKPAAAPPAPEAPPAPAPVPPTPPVAEPSRVAVVLLALRTAEL